MAITYLSGQRIQGLSSDTKPTDVPVGSEFEQTDDYKNYQFGSPEVYNVTTEDDTANMDQYHTGIGIQFNGSADQGLLTQVIFYMKSTASPEGSITARYYKGESLTETEIASAVTGTGTSGGALTADNVPATETAYTFTFGGTNEIVTDDIIAIHWVQSPSTSDKINIYTDYGLSTTDWGTANRDTRESGWTKSTANSVKATINSKKWVERGTAL